MRGSLLEVRRRVDRLALAIVCSRAQHRIDLLHHVLCSDATNKDSAKLTRLTTKAPRKADVKFAA